MKTIRRGVHRTTANRHGARPPARGTATQAIAAGRAKQAQQSMQHRTQESAAAVAGHRPPKPEP
eukprot:11396623-Alexandrium_andersonii.AAC.1